MLAPITSRTDGLSVSNRPRVDFRINAGGSAVLLGVRSCVAFIVQGESRPRLVQLARERGWNIARTIEVREASGREALERLEHLMHEGTPSGIIADTLDVPGVGLQRLLRSLGVLAARSVQVVSLEQPWLSTTGAQGALIEWLVAAADREHREKVRAALSRVRAEGRRLGRPRAVIPAERVLALRAAGASIRSIAREVGLGVATIQRFLAVQAQGKS